MTPDRREFVASIAAEIVAMTLPTRSGHAPSAFRPTTQRIRRAVTSGTVPGAAVAWFDGADGGIVNVGSARTLVPVGDDTVFEAASLSKPAFALGVLSLAKRHDLDLDRPISEIVDLRAETDDARVYAVTPRHALTHSSGLPNWRFQPGPLRCAFAPGARFSYSGEGIFLLQRLVEHVTGTGLAAFMRETVFAPLHMTSTSFAYDRGFSAGLATPHDRFGRSIEHRTSLLGERLTRRAVDSRHPLEEWTWPEMRAALPTLDPPQRPLPVFSLVNAASSLLTTAHDYRAVMREIARRRMMTTPRIAVVPDVSWGLGVGVEGGRPPLAFHWGDNDGFKAMMACRIGSERGVVILTNGDAGIAPAARTLREFFGPQHPGFSWVEAMYRSP